MDEYVLNISHYEQLRVFDGRSPVPDYICIPTTIHGCIDVLKYTPLLKIAFSLPVAIPLIVVHDAETNDIPVELGMYVLDYLPMMVAAFGSIENIVEYYIDTNNHLDENDYRIFIDWLMICGRNDAIEELRRFRLSRVYIPEGIQYKETGVQKIMRDVGRRRFPKHHVYELWYIEISYHSQITKYWCYIGENDTIRYENHHDLINVKYIPFTELDHYIKHVAKTPFIAPKIDEIPFAHKSCP